MAAALEPLDTSSLLIVTVELDGLTVTDGLSAYGDPADPLLPLDAFARLLELDVDVSPKQHRVVGRIGEARRSMLIDVDSGIARLGATNITLKPGDVVVAENDIYVRLSLASRLLPLETRFDSSNQILSLKATEKLPLQGRLERMARRRQETTGGGPTESSIDIPAPYRLFSLPAFDVSANYGRQTQTPNQITAGEVRMAGDLLYTDFQGYFSTDQTGSPQTARVLFERKSATGMFGPLKARTVDVGDVFTPSLALGPRSLGGRGVFLSTLGAEQSQVFHQVDLRGELPLGYDVELYVNDVLRSGQNTPNKGRYEFLNVPLSPGVNVIRIITYGPRGERNEETRIINLGGGQLEKGEATFEMGVVDQESPVFRLTRQPDSDFALPQAHGLRAAANLNYGLTSTLTVNLSAALAPTLTGDAHVVNLGARTSLFGISTQLDLASDLKGGEAAALGLAGRYDGVSATVHHAIFQGNFVDEGGAGYTIDRLTRSRTEVTVDGNLPLRGTELPLSLRTQRIAYQNGDSSLIGSVRTSATVRGFYLSGGVDYDRQVTLGVSTQTVGGFLALSSFRNFRTQIRASLDYNILPTFQAQALAVTIDHQLNPVVGLRFGIGENLVDLGSTNFQVGGVFHLRLADLSVSGNYNTGDHSWALGATMNFGLSYDPWSRRYQMGSPGPASGGGVLFRAFEDDNANGQLDPGERPVPNIVVQGGEKDVVTDANGRAMIRNAGAGPTGRLHVDLEKVDDLSLSPPATNINIAPRPGSRTVINYPIQPTGEVLVNVKLRRPDGQVVGLSAVNVQLHSAGGFTTEMATDFDGSAYIEKVPLGPFTVTLDPEQAQRLRMSAKAPAVGKVERGGFAKTVELEVTFAPRPVDDKE